MFVFAFLNVLDYLQTHNRKSLKFSFIMPIALRKILFLRTYFTLRYLLCDTWVFYWLVFAIKFILELRNINQYCTNMLRANIIWEYEFLNFDWLLQRLIFLQTVVFLSIHSLWDGWCIY